MAGGNLNGTINCEIWGDLPEEEDYRNIFKQIFVGVINEYEANAREVLIDSTTKKEKKWTYLVIFLMGIISFPIGYILTLSVRSMINLEGIWQLLFPLLIFSVLFAIGLAAFKKQPQAYYSLKAFNASFAGMIFMLVMVF